MVVGVSGGRVVKVLDQLHEFRLELLALHHLKCDVLRLLALILAVQPQGLVVSVRLDSDHRVLSQLWPLCSVLISVL